MNTIMNGYVMDTSGLKIVQPPGLRSPSQRISYDSQDVQDHLVHAFGGLIPCLQIEESDFVRYYWDDGSGRDTCAESVPVESMAAIPKGEMLRLMEGWIMLRKLAQNPNLPQGMDAMLLNFRIPDPRRAPTFYRVYNCTKTRQQKIHICWGYESAKMPSIPIDRAVAAFFGVTVENIGSLLATSLVTHATTERIPSLTQTALYPYLTSDADPARKSPSHWKWVAAGLASAVVVLTGALIAGNISNTKATSVSVKTEEISNTPIPTAIPSAETTPVPQQPEIQAIAQVPPQVISQKLEMTVPNKQNHTQDRPKLDTMTGVAHSASPTEQIPSPSLEGMSAPNP